jgi:trans-2,3-dihydro-3-hydroxyanthranilate isomerase
VPEYRYLHYDVFTDTPLQGNPLAVLPDARGLTAEQMQAVAREMAFSETTFVLPPERDDTDARMRIFTPGTELPMAGHPTVGSTFALAHEGLIAAGRERWTFGLGIGPTPVELAWSGGILDFAWMTQPVPTSDAPLDDPALAGAVARALGLGVEDLADGLPLQTVSAGVPFLFVPLRSRAAVDRARPDLAAMQQLQEEHGLAHYYVFTSEPGPPEATTYSRMFAPVLGIIEDPATGGASGPLGGYLVRHRVVRGEAARTIRNLQGVAMGRPSWIHVDVEGNADRLDRVRVGGRAVLVATGTLYL